MRPNNRIVTVKEISQRLTTLFQSLVFVSMMGVVLVAGYTLWNILATPEGNLQTQVNNLTQVVNNITNTLNDLNITNITNILNELEKLNTTELLSLEQRLAAAETNIGELDANVTHLQAEIDAITGGSSNSIQDLTNAILAISAGSNNTIANLTNTVNNLTNVVNGIVGNGTITIIQILNDLTALNNTVNNQQQQIDNITIQGNQTITVINQDIDNIVNQITVINNTLVTLITVIGNGTDNITQAVLDLVLDLSNQVLLLNTTVTNLTARVVSLEAWRVTATTQIGTLQFQVAALQGNVTTLAGQIAILQANMSSLQSQITIIQGNITSMNARISAIEAKLDFFNVVEYSSNGSFIWEMYGDGTNASGVGFSGPVDTAAPVGGTYNFKIERVTGDLSFGVLTLPLPASGSLILQNVGTGNVSNNEWYRAVLRARKFNDTSISPQDNMQLYRILASWVISRPDLSPFGILPMNLRTSNLLFLNGTGIPANKLRKSAVFRSDTFSVSQNAWAFSGLEPCVLTASALYEGCTGFTITTSFWNGNTAAVPEKNTLKRNPALSTISLYNPGGNSAVVIKVPMN